MPKNFLPPAAKAIFAKALHDLAAPLSVLGLCLDDLKKALPDSADMIESSVEILGLRLKFWRTLITGRDDSPNFAEAHALIRALGKLKKIDVAPLASENYGGSYARPLLAMAYSAIEALPKGGSLSVDPASGTVTAKGAKCHLPAAFAETLANDFLEPDSRRAVAFAIKELARLSDAEVVLEIANESFKLSLASKSPG